MAVIAYLITHRASGRAYVGITVKTLSARWAAHQSAARRGAKTHIANAIRAYGADAFAVEQIGEAMDRVEAAELERRLIVERGTMTPAGFNLTSGGEKNVGFTLAPEVREKQRAGRVGKRQPAAARKALSEMRRGVPLSDSTRLAMSRAKRGRAWTPAQRAALTAAMQTPEYREKMRAASAKRWAK